MKVFTRIRGLECEVVFNDQEIANELARKALYNRTGKAKVLRGQITAKILGHPFRRNTVLAEVHGLGAIASIHRGDAFIAGTRAQAAASYGLEVLGREVGRNPKREQYSD